MVAKQKLAAPKPANENSNDKGGADQDALGLSALAEGVLARDFRPRVSSIRRLAEAVLALQNDISDLKKAGNGSAKTRLSGEKTAKKGSKKKRKLAKIPGQKGK